MPHLEKDLRQKRKIGRHESERAQQRSDVPKRQHCGRHEDDERQDHNTDTPYEFRHSQENNKVLTEAQVCYAHVVEEKRNKQNRRSEGGDNLEVTQHEEQCHRNAKQLGKHIECTQEHYHIEKF